MMSHIFRARLVTQLHVGTGVCSNVCMHVQVQAPDKLTYIWYYHTITVSTHLWCMCTFVQSAAGIELASSVSSSELQLECIYSAQRAGLASRLARLA